MLSLPMHNDGEWCAMPWSNNWNSLGIYNENNQFSFEILLKMWHVFFSCHIRSTRPENGCGRTRTRLFSQFFVNVMREKCQAKFATEVWIGWPVTKLLLELQLPKNIHTHNLFESPTQNSRQILAGLRRHISSAPWFSILLKTTWGKISKSSWDLFGLAELNCVGLCRPVLLKRAMAMAAAVWRPWQQAPTLQSTSHVEGKWNLSK